MKRKFKEDWYDNSPKQPSEESELRYLEEIAEVVCEGGGYNPETVEISSRGFNCDDGEPGHAGNNFFNYRKKGDGEVELTITSDWPSKRLGKKSFYKVLRSPEDFTEDIFNNQYTFRDFIWPINDEFEEKSQAFFDSH